MGLMLAEDDAPEWEGLVFVPWKWAVVTVAGALDSRTNRVLEWQ